MVNYIICFIIDIFNSITISYLTIYELQSIEVRTSGFDIPSSIKKQSGQSSINVEWKETDVHRLSFSLWIDKQIKTRNKYKNVNYMFGGSKQENTEYSLCFEIYGY